MAKRFDALIAFAHKRVRDATPQRIVWKLSVEGMADEDMPADLREDLTAFRHLPTGNRQRKVEQWFTAQGAR